MGLRQMSSNPASHTCVGPWGKSSNFSRVEGVLKGESVQRQRTSVMEPQE